MDTINQDEVAIWILNNQNPSLEIIWSEPILKIKLNRPSKKNALNRSIIKSLLTLFPFIETQSSIRVILLEGGENQYCSGADLEEIAQIKSKGFDSIYENNQLYGQLIFRISHCNIPLISLVDGPALGGGMGLACASDIILATPKSRFGMPEPRLGIIAGQIFPYVSRKLGLSYTQQMSLQGLSINGETAFEWGLLTQLCRDYDSLTVTANEIIHNILKCGPEAIIKTKSMINKTFPVSISQIQTIAYEVAMATVSSEGIEGNNAFMEKRSPTWK